jgi:cytosine/adenosine deaminase-related metal-dependent hydrolase
MVAAGTSAVGDVANALDHVDVIGEVGLRGLIFHELVGSREARTGDALADAERERLHFIDHEPWPDGVGYVPAPHAPYSAGSELLRRIFIAAAATPHPTAVHVAEDPDEITLLRHGTGRWAPILAGLGVVPGSRTPGLAPVAYLASLGAFAGPRPPLLVHMVHASAEDRDLARQHRAPVVLCPRSNLHIGGRLPDVPALLAAGLVVALGTDGLASTPDPSLWGEIATLSERFADVNPEVWLRAATLGGAHALGLPLLGALAPGLRPGVISVAIPDVAAPLPSLVRAAQPSIEWITRP